MSYHGCLERERRRIREISQWLFEASQVSIKVNLDPLETDDTLPYLGCTIKYYKSNWADLYHNLGKVQQRCGKMLKVLAKAGATVQAWAMMS